MVDFGLWLIIFCFVSQVALPPAQVAQSFRFPSTKDHCQNLGWNLFTLKLPAHNVPPDQIEFVKA